MTPQTQQWFLDRSITLHGKRFIYTNTQYINKRTNIKITCRNHGEFITTPVTHYTSTNGGCKVCGKIKEYRTKRQYGKPGYRTNRSSFKAFIYNTRNIDTTNIFKKANEIHNNSYTYKEDAVITNLEKHKLEITCKTHGIFYQTVKNHLQGQKCPQCANNQLIKEQLEELLHKRYPTCSIITNKPYYLNKESIKVYCSTHGVFSTKVYNIKRNLGCSKCGTIHSGFKVYKPATLYYLSINNGTAYKIGITNNSVEQRFSTIDLTSIRIIKTWHYSIGQECYDAEQQILKEFKQYRYTGPSLLQSGNTELFNKDILALDTPLII